MSVHSAFSIQELLELICDDIRRGIFEDERNATLLSMALTCRSFATAALPALWRDLEYFAFLIKTLPPHCWTEKEIKSESDSYTQMISPGLIAEQDCDRYRIYSGFVRSVRFYSDDHYHIDQRYFRRLQVALGPQTKLLPNLQELVWDDPPLTLEFVLTKYFYVPSLVFLEMRADGVPVEYESTLRLLPQMCPHLARLHFMGDMVNGHGSQYHPEIKLLSQVILQMAQLTVLHVTYLTADLVIALARKDGLPLERLLVYEDSPVDWNVVRNALGPKVNFPGLKRLIVHATFQEAIELFDACTFPLENLAVNLEKCPWITGDEYSQLLSKIADAVVDRSALYTLCFDVDSVEEFEEYTADKEIVHNAEAVKGSHLSKLLSFPNLQNFWIHSNRGYDIEDKEMEAIAKGLPRLTELCFFSMRFYRTGPPMLTINALSHLAIHCPNLRTIRMAFDATNPQPLHPNLADALASNPCQLKRFFIPHSPVSNPEAVASIISTLFPKLGFMNCDTRFPQGSASWDRVKDYIKMTPLEREEPQLIITI